MVKIKYVCKICDGEYDDRKKAEKCEARGEPAEELPKGTVLLTNWKRDGLWFYQFLHPHRIKGTHELIYKDHTFTIDEIGQISDVLEGNGVVIKASERRKQMVQSEIEELCKRYPIVKALRNDILAERILNYDYDRQFSNSQ